jgi:hypothetical protein
VLFTVAGSSCSGKTTAAARCTDIERLVVHDFDEIGVPSDADTAWRQAAGETWLRRVIAEQADGVDVLLTGQSPIGEILATPSAPEITAIAACLLDVDDRERWRRLEARDPGRWDTQAKRSFIGWARWLRGHSADAHHKPEVITAGGWSEMRWDRWDAVAAHDWHVTVIDSTGHPPEHTALELRRWIAAHRAAQAASA